MQKTMERSSIDIESNLYLLEDHFFSPLDDRGFLASIEEPRALEQLKTDVVDERRNTYFQALTPRQQEIYHRMSLHCEYAFENDYPWGVPLGAPENAKAVCYCKNLECAHFLECRPDVDVETVRREAVKAANQPEAQDAASDVEDLAQKAEKTEAAKDALEKQPLESADDVPMVQTSEEEQSSEKPSDTQVPDVKLPEQETSMDQATEIEAAEADASVTEPQEETVVEPTQQDRPQRKTAKNARTELLMQKTEATPKAATMHDWLATLPRGTQEDFLACGVHERVFVNAGPGTGKTWALIQRIVQLLQDDTIAPENVVVLCYSRAAKAVIEKRLMNCSREGTIDQRWRLMDIFTLDSFSARILMELRRLGIMLPKNCSGVNSYDWNIQQMLRSTKEHPEIFAEAQYFIVDEIQDLVRERAELVLAILDALPESCGVSLLGDFCQAIYDYDAKGGMDAEAFYEEIFQRADALRCMEFSENHRMTAERLALLQPLREALLRGDAAAVRTVAADFAERIPAVDIDFENEDTFGDAFEQADDLAILTRMNGQTLRISSALLSADVMHTRLLPEETSALAPWIADVFCHFDGETIEREEFVAAWHAHGPADVDDETIDACWRALTAPCGGRQSRYEVEELLQNVLESGASEPLLFAEAWLPQKNITVSNVHRAKGREYEDVLLMNDVFALSKKKDMDALQEGKVLYVALSRARGTLHQTRIRWRKVLPFGNRDTMWYPLGSSPNKKHHKKRKRSILEKFTFEPQMDLDITRFAQREVQEALEALELGAEELGLEIRCSAFGEHGEPLYELMDSDGDWSFGRVSDTFVADFEKLYCFPFSWGGNPCNVKEADKHFMKEDYPMRFSGLSCPSKTTCIGEAGRAGDVVRTYGALSIWYGLTAYGLMSYDYDDCY